MGRELIIGTASWAEDQELLAAIRMEVFVREQGVPEAEEIDEMDPQARHWLALLAGQAVGTARALLYEKTCWKVGRVAVRRSARGKGVGAELMRAIARSAVDHGITELLLDAQNHAIPFYEGLGYTREGGEFLDAGIPHHRMRLKLHP